MRFAALVESIIYHKHANFSTCFLNIFYVRIQKELTRYKKRSIVILINLNGEKYMTQKCAPDYLKYKPGLIRKGKKEFKAFQKVFLLDASPEKIKETQNYFLSQIEKHLENFPYIGEKDLGRVFLNIVLMTPLMITLFDTAEKLDIPQRDAGFYLYKRLQTLNRAIPAPFRWLQRKILLGSPGKKAMKDLALRSQKKKYTGDWVFEYIPGDGKTFQYKAIFSECAIEKYLKSINKVHILPYLCLTDWVGWNEIKINASRTQTLGCGGTCCNFTYVGEGKPEYEAWPPEKLPERKNYSANKKSRVI